MKKWLINNFLPMWAKECVLKDNERLKTTNRALEEQVAQQKKDIQYLKDRIRRLQAQLNR